MDINQLIARAQEYILKDESLQLIRKAYFFAEKAHQGQVRASGAPYINHPLEVADTLVSLKTGPKTIVAGLLHDVIEDCEVSVETIKKEFDEEIATLVGAVTKVGMLKNNMQLADFQAATHRKLFIAMSNDVRVIIVKLADRLNNMRTLQYLPEGKREKIAKETLEVYAPIAHRLGLAGVKTELEDLSLFYLYPKAYQDIVQLLDKDEATRKEIVAKMREQLEKIIQDNHLDAVVIGRDKSYYSIYKKMWFKGYKFDDIYDLMALRIITANDVNCYEVLGYIHNAFTPLPGRFKDYIATPKPNLYQSLHTTVVGGEGHIFEVQIRTKEMDEVAEVGIAAHWRYKENSNYDYHKEQKEIEERLHWFRDFVVLNEEMAKIEDQQLVAALQRDIFEANVYVLSPKGKLIDLPQGSTPIDFAYRIHTQVGHNAIGATVNGLMVPLNYVLKTGDLVSIKTASKDQKPSERWLEFVVTSNAINCIRKALTKPEGEERQAVEKGKALLEEYAKKNKINLEHLLSIGKNRSWPGLNVTSLEEAYRHIGLSMLTPKTFIDKLETSRADPQAIISRKNFIESTSNREIVVEGTDSVMTAIASCCRPIPGDDIVGYISKGKGIKVHRKSCPNVQAGNRQVNVYWNAAAIDKNRTYKVDLEVWANDRPQLLIDVFNRLSTIKITVLTVNATSVEENLTAKITLTIAVSNQAELESVFVALENIPDIFEIKRIIK